MKKYLIHLVLAISVLSMMVPGVEAKRLGGGSSFGKQSQGISRQASPQSVQPAKPAAPPAAGPQIPPSKPASPWKGILGGALLGLGLGALFSHFGLGGAMGGVLGSIIMIALLALAVMFIVRMFKSKNNPGNPAPYASGGAPVYTPEIGSRLDPAPFSPSGGSVDLARPVAPFGVPTDFDVPGFLRTAKTYFIRLQAAWDRADAHDIQEFSSPEMFAELKMQLQERGNGPNRTDVMHLEAELLGIETLEQIYLASVKFSGMIKEQDNAPAEAFSEVWNLSKPLVGQSGWVLAGIQQLA